MISKRQVEQCIKRIGEAEMFQSPLSDLLSSKSLRLVASALVSALQTMTMNLLGCILLFFFACVPSRLSYLFIIPRAGNGGLHNKAT